MGGPPEGTWGEGLGKNEIDAAVEAAQVAAKVEVPKQIVQATAKALTEKFNAMAPVMAENLQTLRMVKKLKTCFAAGVILQNSTGAQYPLGGPSSLYQ
jgi:hypothetical protein